LNLTGLFSPYTKCQATRLVQSSNHGANCRNLRT